MDERRFDEWTRALRNGASRRETLRALAGGAGAGLLSLLSASAAAGRTRGGKDATCRCAFGGRRFCQSEPCEFDEQCCSRKCVNFNRFNEPQELGGEECRGKRCLCRFEGARCVKDCACCSGRCADDKCGGR